MEGTKKMTGIPTLELTLWHAERIHSQEVTDYLPFQSEKL